MRVCHARFGFRSVPEYRRSFAKCSGKEFVVVGWDVTGLAWLGVRPFEVLSVEPRLLEVVRSGRSSKEVRRDF
ncbi:hypothetical protein ABTL87_19140 [Acinetobacter baumannii]